MLNPQIRIQLKWIWHWDSGMIQSLQDITIDIVIFALKTSWFCGAFYLLRFYFQLHLISKFSLISCEVIAHHTVLVASKVHFNSGTAFHIVSSSFSSNCWITLTRFCFSSCCSCECVWGLRKKTVCPYPTTRWRCSCSWSRCRSTSRSNMLGIIVVRLLVACKTHAIINPPQIHMETF